MKNIDFIKQLIKGGKVIFCGSFVLKTLGAINRDYDDIDIILPFELYDSIKLIHLNDHEFNGVLATKIKTIIFDDNTKVDILFVKDYNSIKPLDLKTELFGDCKGLDMENIMLIKNYLVIANNQKEKHLKDIIAISSYLLSK